MKTCVGLILLGTFINGATSMVHTYMNFDTTLSQIPNLPEYVSVGFVNGLQTTHYDSETRRCEPRQQWLNRLTEQEPRFWERLTEKYLDHERLMKTITEYFKQQLNLTEGAHVLQLMSGCDWDDESGEITGYYQYGFDGEDFISFDWKTETWVAAKPEASITTQTWDTGENKAIVKNYINNECARSLKVLAQSKESVLNRTELPLVSLLQKSPSSPVTCHATGFYPNRAVLFWTKGGHEVHEGLDPAEILPNHDGTFQMRVDLDVSSVPSEDWDKYECVFQLSGVKEELLTKLDRAKIRTNPPSEPGVEQELVKALNQPEVDNKYKLST